MAKYRKLFEPAKIGNIEVKNRLVMLPMVTRYATVEGEVTPRMIAYYEERARGGVGTIFIEMAHVVPSGGRAASSLIGVYKDDFIAGLGDLSEGIKAHGAKGFVQLYHGGRQASPVLNEGLSVAFSDIPCPVIKAPVRVLSVDEIKELENAFVDAAQRVQRAGFDGVEFHAAHGYLLCQSLSPYANQRTDEYGGSPEKRMQFLLNIIKKTRDRVGADLAISVRLSIDEFVQGGLKVEDSIRIAKALEEAGGDIIDSGSGIYETFCTTVDPYTFKDGWRVYLAEALKKEVNIPVIACGLLRDPAMDERILEDDRADFIGLGRSLIADPEWPKKVYDRREEDIRPCIACDYCVADRGFRDLTMACRVNPLAGRETTLGTIGPARKSKKVIVVGGGPAGLEAARVAKERGHEVTLFEKETVLGGQLNVAAVPPNKYRLTELKTWLERQARKIGVRIELGKEIDAEMIAGMGADVVILAVGSKPFIPTQDEIKGIDSGKVTTIYEILEEKVQVEEKAIVYGGNMTALETAEFLAEKGKKVTVVYRRDQEFLGRDLNHAVKMAWFPKLFSHTNIKFLLKNRIIEVTKNGAVIVDEAGRKEEVSADKVILAIGIVPERKPEQELRGMRSPEVYLIGDCGTFEPGTITGATYMGTKVASEI